MIPEPAPTQSRHLSEEALDDLLLDMASPSDVAHLASCGQCTARFETFQSSMAFFNRASSAWSEARSNSISREFTPRRSVFRILPAWSIAAAFFFALALSFLAGTHRGITSHGNSARNFVQENIGSSQQEIASDNAMLDAIDTAISQPVPSPVEVYGIEKTSEQQSRRSAPREVRD